MRRSIFDIEIRIDIDYEFAALINILNEPRTLYYNNCYYSVYEFLNSEIFPIWKYKGMFIDLDDFCDRLEIDFKSHICNEEKFLYLLELLINLWPIAEDTFDFNYKRYFSKRVIEYMRMNLPLIIEKMNYKIDHKNDKYVLIKRDSDVDSVLDIIVDDCSELLLDYNDIRNNSVESKKSILKKIDLYIEKDKKIYQSIDNDTYNSIQNIVNNMGINHPIKKEPYISISQHELIEWYDKCFKLMIHLIRKKEINEINKKIKGFSNN